MTSAPAPQKIEVIRANRMLQAKVGTGKLSTELIARAQAVIDENETDFAPLAEQFLNELAEAIGKSQVEGQNTAHKESITNAIMQLKANAATFQYNLVGTLAGIMLTFMERIEDMDEDAISIADAHYRTLHVLIKKEMKGDGGTYGKELERELNNACVRYFLKRDKKSA